MKRLWILVLLACGPSLGEPIEAGPPEPKVEFGRDIRPLIERSCKLCHYPGVLDHTGVDKTGLDLSSLGALRQGGFQWGNGIVIPGNPYASVLVRKLEGTYDVGQRMPRKGNYFTDEEIELVERWIEQGAEGDPSE